MTGARGSTSAARPWASSLNAARSGPMPPVWSRAVRYEWLAIVSRRLRRAFTGTQEALGTSGPYGRATWGCNWITWKRNTSKASLNTDRLGSKSANFKQSVASHELGHYIGVRHSTVTPAVMVMNTSRNRGTVYETDHADDECAVNDRYENDIWEVDC